MGIWKDSILNDKKIKEISFNMCKNKEVEYIYMDVSGWRVGIRNVRIIWYIYCCKKRVKCIIREYKYNVI